MAAEPVERNPEVYRSLLSYVTDARKEEIYRLHKLDPQVGVGIWTESLMGDSGLWVGAFFLFF